jgi:hypothetical protein
MNFILMCALYGASLFGFVPLNTNPVWRQTYCTKPGNSEVHNPPQVPFTPWPGRR